MNFINKNNHIIQVFYFINNLFKLLFSTFIRKDTVSYVNVDVVTPCLHDSGGSWGKVVAAATLGCA